MFESHWIPRCTPEIADRIKSTVIVTMMPIATAVERGMESDR
jgi:hypothetical protein